jgi:hypothetical protein
MKYTFFKWFLHNRKMILGKNFQENGSIFKSKISVVLLFY